MDRWLDEHLGRLLTISGVIIMISIGVIGWFLNRTVTQVDNQFKEQNKLILQEVKERKEEDRALELKIDSKLDVKQFNEFKASTEKSFTTLESNQRVIQEDIKEILKNTSH